MGIIIGTYRVLMGRSEQNIPLGSASLFPVFRRKKRVSLKSALMYMVF
jgi:putative hemolysin